MLKVRQLKITGRPLEPAYSSKSYNKVFFLGVSVGLANSNVAVEFSSNHIQASFCQVL